MMPSDKTYKRGSEGWSGHSRREENPWEQVAKHSEDNPMEEKLSPPDMAVWVPWTWQSLCSLLPFPLPLLPFFSCANSLSLPPPPCSFHPPGFFHALLCLCVSCYLLHLRSQVPSSHPLLWLFLSFPLDFCPCSSGLRSSRPRLDSTFSEEPGQFPECSWALADTCKSDDPLNAPEQQSEGRCIGLRFW